MGTLLSSQFESSMYVCRTSAQLHVYASISNIELVFGAVKFLDCSPTRKLWVPMFGRVIVIFTES